MRGRENEPNPDGPDLKDVKPPKSLTGEESAIWRELQRALHPGVAFKSDALALEALTRMVALMRAGDMRPALMGQIRAALGSFGMTPAERSKVTAIKPAGEPRGFAALRNRPD